MTEDEHKTMLKELEYDLEDLKGLEYFPNEMERLLDLLEKTNSFDDQKSLNIESVEEMYNIVASLPIN